MYTGLAKVVQGKESCIRVTKVAQLTRSVWSDAGAGAASDCAHAARQLRRQLTVVSCTRRADLSSDI